MAKTPPGAKAPLDHLEAEAKLNPERTQVTEITWQGEQMYVLPVMKWKASALRALKESDLDVWAEKCLTNDSYATWAKIDPTLEECEEFFTLWGEATGESRPN